MTPSARDQEHQAFLGSTELGWCVGFFFFCCFFLEIVGLKRLSWKPPGLPVKMCEGCLLWNSRCLQGMGNSECMCQSLMEVSCSGGTLWSKWPEVPLHPSPAGASLTGEGLGAQRHSPVPGWGSGDRGGTELLCLEAQTDEELSSCESSPTFIPR